MSEPTQLPAGAVSEQGEDTAGRLLDIVRRLAIELHGQRGGGRSVKWDSRLDRDLGIDSLGRAELLARIEREFRLRLPESLLGQAETPRDLLAALEAVPAEDAGADAVTAREPALRLDAGGQTGLSVSLVPDEASTLTEVLDWHARRHPERAHIVLWDEAGREPPISYGALASDARAVARGLLERGFQPGARAALMLPTGKPFFQAFFGILYAGGIPVPIYPPARLSQIEEHLRRQVKILDNAEVSGLITTPEARPVAAFLKSHVRSLRWVETSAELRGDVAQPVDAGLHADFSRSAGSVADQIALLQYTSGSTGDPKGVVLTHANLLANIRAFGERLEIDSNDVCVTWLPLYHDMGLIGTWLGGLYFAAPVVILSPLTFLARPAQWLWAIHRHRGTISAAPNFAFELCLRKIEDRDLEGLDLSSWRWLLNGAEPVSPSTIARFSERFAACGFRPEAMAPVYGMAENAVALTIPRPDRGPVVDRVDRAAMARDGHARPSAPGDGNALEFVACGSPLRGHQVRIVDFFGREVEDRRQGRLQFRGPSATRGYYRNEARTSELLDGEWLNSGDLAYIADGDIYLTGRSKDIIIRAGRNIYPQEIEEAVGGVSGVRKGCVAAFASTDRANGTERIVIVAETRLSGEAEQEELRRHIEQRAADVLEAAPDEVVLVAPQTVPKTSSGKIRRAATREVYETKRLTAGRRALWWQMARLGCSGLIHSLRRGLRHAADLVYALWFWLVIAGSTLYAWPLVVAAPRRTWRFAILRSAARLAFRFLGIAVHVSGGEHLRERGILVANHASYLDGLVLIHCLLGEIAFVAKKELQSNLFTRLFLRRIGALFVERFEAAGSVQDSRAVAAAARSGERVLIFPEGTFTRMPGLLEFRMGAFMAAADAGVPVVPMTVRGTRSVLREGQWRPGRAAVHVEIAPPIQPDGGGFEAALRLRQGARAAILARCGEPDLAGETTILQADRN